MFDLSHRGLYYFLKRTGTGEVSMDKLLAFVDRNPRWFVVGLITHSAIVIVLTTVPFIFPP